MLLPKSVISNPAELDFFFTKMAQVKVLSERKLEKIRKTQNVLSKYTKLTGKKSVRRSRNLTI